MTKFTYGPKGYQESYKLTARKVNGGIEIDHEIHASMAFLTKVIARAIYEHNKSYNKAPDGFVKNAFWLIIRDKVDEMLKEDLEEKK